MHTITFTCETITPMFLSGADQSVPELRPPSIKGALRFWWRAMNGHLDLPTLKEQEAMIFGGTDEKVGRSKVIVICEQEDFTFPNTYQMIAHRGSTTKSFNVKQRITVKLKLTKNIDLGNQRIFDSSSLKALFEVFCYLGGLGKRSRRGNGSIKIEKIKINEEAEIDYVIPSFNDLPNILNTVSLDNPAPFKISAINSDLIESSFSNVSRLIPNILTIERKDSTKNLVEKRKQISQATHDVKDAERIQIEKEEVNDGVKKDMYKYKLKYAKYIGAGSPRFASPIYITICPTNDILITKLKTIKEQNGVATIISQP